MDGVSQRVERPPFTLLGLIQVSEKLPTYPSPKPTFYPKKKVSANVSLGQGQVGSLPETYLDLSNKVSRSYLGVKQRFRRYCQQTRKYCILVYCSCPYIHSDTLTLHPRDLQSQVLQQKYLHLLILQVSDLENIEVFLTGPFIR